MRNFFLYANETKKNFNFFAASLVDCSNIKIEFSEKFKNNRNDDSMRRLKL